MDTKGSEWQLAVGLLSSLKDARGEAAQRMEDARGEAAERLKLLAAKPPKG